MTAQSPPRNSHHAPPAHEPPAALRAAGLVIALTVGLAILFIAFGLPAAKSGPHGVPIGISGPQAANGQFASMLEQSAPGAFAVTYYPGDETLRSAIRDRDVYGGLAITPEGPTLLLASGGSPMVAQLLTQVGSGVAQHTGMPIRTEDLAPLSQNDPRGTGLAASALPLALAGLLPAAVLAIVFPSQMWLRFGAMVVFAGVAAVTIASVLFYVFGSIESNFWGVTAGLTLGILATALTMLGLGSLFGRIGLGIGAAAVMLLGNPLSGLASAPEMLPAGWGAFGQWLPQGGTATLLRSTAYFDGAGAAPSILLLTCWSFIGLTLLVVAALRQREVDLRRATRVRQSAIAPPVPATVPGLAGTVYFRDDRGGVLSPLNSARVGLDDRDALRILRDAVDPALGSDGLIRRFYTRWFAIDTSVRDLFPPDMDAQRTAFAKAMTWLFSEMIAQRAEEPVAFLAQLGRDHRKYGVTQRHYDSMQDALLTTLRTHLIESWDDKLAAATQDAVALIIGVMRGSADAEKGPPFRDGTVIEHLRITRDVSVVRLQLDKPLYYHPGQYVTVQVPQWPRRWRYLSPAIPADRGGALEFHIRSVSGGMVSTAIVGETKAGDRWRLSNPHGGMHIDRSGGDVLMVAGSTGLAPLRTLIMDLTRYGENPRVHLFFGARYPSELYDLRTLWQIASTNPWLSVTPVSEFNTEPPWAADYPDVEPPRGLHVRQTGMLPEVVTRYGGWGDRQILICGGPKMVEATKAALIEKGAPAERIQHDPVTS